MRYFLFLLMFSVWFCTISDVTCYIYDNKTTNRRRVCVIGAGVSGLTTARYLQEANVSFTVLEATQHVGGTWRYDPKVGLDEFGQPLHTSMYKYLRTNLPKPTMELRDFPLPKHWASFPTWQQYYDYLKDYAKHFDLEKHVQFLHLVTSVRRVENVWKVKHKYLPTGQEYEEEYDYVIVGNGHHSKPVTPDLPGEQLFKGRIIHSHDYREPEQFKNRTVLVIGAGPSGMDIGLEVARCAKTLVHSHHSMIDFKTPFPANYIRKRDVKEFNATGAIFKDGTFEELDDVIYCTGYEYYYPFLDESSGLTITKAAVTPLYKYVVNINQPSMFLTGLMVRACLVVAIDAQARYVTAVIKGDFSLPSQEKMMEEFQKKVENIKARRLKLSFIHNLDREEDKYYASLTEESGIARVPPVLSKIRFKDTQAKIENLYTYRDYVYNVVDNENFTRTLEADNFKYPCTQL